MRNWPPVCGCSTERPIPQSGCILRARSSARASVPRGFSSGSRKWSPFAYVHDSSVGLQELAPQMGFHVRPLRSSEFIQWRDLRLRALRESPDAFGSRYEDQVKWPLSRWRERAAALAAGDNQIMFVAEAADGHLAGCAGAYVRPDGVPAVISMWTEPESRRHGVAKALLAALADWGRRRGACRLGLSVIRGNHPATQLYLSFGFHPTHVSVVNEHGQIEDEMALDL